jgi:hypothetical protein
MCTIGARFMVPRSMILLAAVAGAASALSAGEKLVPGQLAHFSRTGNFFCSGPSGSSCSVGVGIFSIDVPQETTRLDVKVTVDGSSVATVYVYDDLGIRQSSAAPKRCFLGRATPGEALQDSVVVGDRSRPEWPECSLAPGTWAVEIDFSFAVAAHSFSGTIVVNTSTGPAIGRLVPEWRVAGGAAFTIAVQGAGFSSGSVVQWSGTPLATTNVSPTQLSASVPASLVASDGSSPRHKAPGLT